MNDYEKLRSIRILDELIDEKIRECENLYTMATKVNAVMEGERVQSSGSGDKMGDTVAKILDLKADITSDIDRLVDLKRECMKVIDAIDDQLLVGILYKRYFEGKTWEVIAEELDVSRQWVTEKHRRWKNSCF